MRYITVKLCLMFAVCLGAIGVITYASGVSTAHENEQLNGVGMDQADLAALKSKYERPEEIPFPENNPFTEAKKDLGHKLFFDPRLSGSNTISCATCHNPSFAWEDAVPTAVGYGMKTLDRKTPTVMNLAWGELYFWDGRANSLEEQALGPIEAAGEMNQALDDLPGKLEGIDGYAEEFRKINGDDGITLEVIADALATYQRTIVSGVSPFDRWVNGKEDAISAAAERGFVLFNTEANCAACHDGWRFTDDSFHDVGLPDDDLGRGGILPNITVMQHAFKTPTLREIDQRAPYMHDGSIDTLREVVDHYADDFVRRESLSAEMGPLDLNEREREDLVAFMRTLTGEAELVAIPALP